MKKIRSSLVLAVIFAFSLFSSAAFAASDNILSGNIKEADGTTGQNTNTGAGVKTGHIQNNAITTDKIADGAVTDSKITGPISASKISSAALDADTVDGKHASDLALVTHNHDGVYQKKYAKVAVVAQSGGDYTDPVAAMNDHATWCGTPSATNPCLLKIMPGIYDIQASPLQMKECIDVEGSGENVTTIIGEITDCINGAVNGASNSELRMLTIENRGIPGGINGSCAYTVGIWNRTASLRITNAKVIVSAQSDYDYGIRSTDSSSLVLSNVAVVVSGADGHNIGVMNYLSSSTSMNNVDIVINGGDRAVGIETGVGDCMVTMRNVSVSVASITEGQTIGVAVNGGITKIENSVITIGPSWWHYTISAVPNSVFVANTRLEGGSIYQPGVKCAGVYDGDFNFYANSCP
ncbi:MAG: hypothetical protein ACM34I_11345 [bacterium]